MNEWKKIIFEALNKWVDVARDFIIGEYHHISKWYDEYDNKKGLAGAVASWVIAFAMVVFVCKLSGVNNIAVSADETIIEESESVYEMSKTNKMVTEDTDNKDTTDMPTSIETQETVTSQEETVAVQEKETIDISKISVSNTPIEDDRNRGDNFASISSLNVKTVSSIKYDKTQFSYGIDVSYHQGKIDWAKVKSSGVDYAFIRVGNRGYETGKLCKDIKFDENVKGALANNIQVGVYFFSQATTEEEALEEASLTLSWIKNYNITLPVVIDWETDVGYRTYSGLSRSGLTNILSVFCDTVSRYGYEPMVYMCKDDFVNRINTTAITSKYKTWVAWYFKEYRNSDYSRNLFKYGDLLPDMSFDYNVWQYSDRGYVNGINDSVDMNIMILPKKVYEVKLDNSKGTFITNIGKPVDLMEGVSASDSSGNICTSYVSVKVYDSTGNRVGKEESFSNPGTYKVIYEFKDSNGTEISKESVLYVRDLPEMYFDGMLWEKNETKVIEYIYDESLSMEENYSAIENLVKAKCTSCYYDTVTGVSAKHMIHNITIQGMDKIIVNNDIRENEADIIYNAKDVSGLEAVRYCKLLIKREIIKEDTETESTDIEQTNETTVLNDETTTDEYNHKSGTDK